MWVYIAALGVSIPDPFTAKRNRTADCVKVLLDVAKESSDWFPPLKAALGGVNALIKHYEVFVESTGLLTSDANPLRISKTSRRRSKTLYLSWIDSNRMSPRQR